MKLAFAKTLLWGTYGKDVAEDHALFGTPLPKCEVKHLGDLDDDHLKRILFGQQQLLILKDRRYQGSRFAGARP